MDSYRHGGNGRDPIGPRGVSGMISNIIFGLILILLGIYAGVRHGGWAWLLVLIGAVLLTVEALVLYLDPIGGPRRRLRLRRHQRHSGDTNRGG